MLAQLDIQAVDASPCVPKVDWPVSELVAAIPVVELMSLAEVLPTFLCWS